ncbi:MAG: TatD family hydrolase [Parvularculales bacterium]
MADLVDSLVDSHCHLDFNDFQDDINAVVERAVQARVGMMLTIGTRLDRFPGVLAVAERFENVYCTVGVHPHEAAEEGGDVSPETLIEHARHPKVIGFGETGLDYYYENSPREAQQAAFRAHIEASRELGLPVIIHSRSADDDMSTVIREEMAVKPFTGLLHCFSSGADLARTALECGLYISLSGIVTFKNAEEVRTVAQSVPLDRLLLETDAPYLAPIPHRGKRNEPAFVSETARFVSSLLGCERNELARRTTDNFFRLFTRADRHLMAKAAA